MAAVYAAIAATIAALEIIEPMQGDIASAVVWVVAIINAGNALMFTWIGAMERHP